MRFWFEHSTDVSLREQLVAQVTLGILSGELAPAERLPSIRELARRFDIHANTVSAGYRQLEAEGWVSSRKGSGVYVRATRPQTAIAGLDPLARLVSNLFATTRRLGIPDAMVAQAVATSANPGAFDRVLLVEPDPELRQIVIAELRENCTLPISGCDFGQTTGTATTTLIATLPSKLQRVTAEFTGARVHCLRIRSVPLSLNEHLPSADARVGVLVGIASRWPDFLRFARTMLVAAGFDSDALIVRDATQPGWRDGLSEAAAVVCDIVTAHQLHGTKTIVARILADDVAAELNAILRPPLS
jgi:GntR family transcriptional regulator